MFIKSLNFKRLIWVCAIVFSSTAFMSPVSAGFLSSLLPTYNISGKITNQNQEPLEGVIVVFEADGLGVKTRAVTDDMGNYLIHPPANTSGLLTVRKENFRIIREKIPNYYQSGRSLVNNYNLHPDWISGKITNQYGVSLEGVKIMVEENGGLSGVQTVITDENGNYKCTIPADSKQYWITINKEGYQTVRDQPYLYGGNTYNYILR